MVDIQRSVEFNKMTMLQMTSPPGAFLSNASIKQFLSKGLEKKFHNQRVLVLIPDHTRSLPLPLLFQTLVEVLHNTRQLEFMVALGTHPPLSEGQLCNLVGISLEERESTFGQVGLLNHAWDTPSALTNIGTMEQDEIKNIAGAHWHESLPDKVEIRLNKGALEYDQIIILGPTFPHEVAGFSGGAKYLFPGISGAEMINATHWLGALAGVVGTIGIKDTPVRTMIHAAAQRLKTPITLIALTVEGNNLSGLFIGDMLTAWSASADFSEQRHIQWYNKPFQQALSSAPPMYDELWTAAKAMYKLEPALDIGGELIIYAPHLDTVSQVFGKYIYEIGYHILPYFLQDWERFKQIPLGVLAHSTHLRGSGVMKEGIETPNIRVSLASKISPEDCTRLNLGYLDPTSIRITEWQNREDESILFVPKAGEVLYRLK
jgi:nickel-dependent lactate racemase